MYNVYVNFSREMIYILLPTFRGLPKTLQTHIQTNRKIDVCIVFYSQIFFTIMSMDRPIPFISLSVDRPFLFTTLSVDRPILSYVHG